MPFDMEENFMACRSYKINSISFVSGDYQLTGHLRQRFPVYFSMVKIPLGSLVAKWGTAFSRLITWHIRSTSLFSAAFPIWSKILLFYGPTTGMKSLVSIWRHSYPQPKFCCKRLCLLFFIKFLSFHQMIAQEKH